MYRSHLLSRLVFGVAFALGVASCSQGTQEGESGSLSLDLTIAGDVEIEEVAWVITGGEMEPMNGTIDTSAPGATASIEVFGLPPSSGQDYRITMEAIATDDETTCKGSEDFGIDIGEVTEIMVMLNCKRPQRFGSVRVNGKFNICAELTKVVVSPLQTSVGNDIDLFSAAEDLDDDDINYLWIGTGGSFDDAGAASTTYTCTDVGDHFVKITVTDEPDSEVCDSSWTVAVTCVPGDALECSDNEDCGFPASGEICVDNECVSDPNIFCNTGDCADDPDLRDDCADAFFLCLIDNPDEEECVALSIAICNSECSDNEDCDAGEICLDNECVPDLECTMNEDCASGEICLDNECVPDLECTMNEDCASGESCVDNECVPDAAGVCGDCENQSEIPQCEFCFEECADTNPNTEGCAVVALLCYEAI